MSTRSFTEIVCRRLLDFGKKTRRNWRSIRWGDEAISPDRRTDSGGGLMSLGSGGTGVRRGSSTHSGRVMNMIELAESVCD